MLLQVLSLSLAWCGAAAPAVNLITNGGFEFGLQGWRPLWCKTDGAGEVTLDP